MKNILFTNEDIQNAITDIKSDPQRLKEFLSMVPETTDGNAIKSVINEGWYEEFNRYDSDVAEQFVSLYLDFAKQNNTKQKMVV